MKTDFIDSYHFFWIVVILSASIIVGLLLPVKQSPSEVSKAVQNLKTTVDKMVISQKDVINQLTEDVKHKGNIQLIKAGGNVYYKHEQESNEEWKILIKDINKP